MLQPNDIERGYIYVSFEPIGASRRVDIVDGAPNLASLADTKYGKYIIGLSYDDKWDSYTITLDEEGQQLWNEELVRIREYFNKWGTASE